MYDAISVPEQSYRYIFPLLQRLGGGNVAIVLPDFEESIPDNVKIGRVIAVDPMTQPFWVEYIPKALESGQLQCLPEPFVVGKGLESIQEGVDANKKGVSAKKVVVEL